MEIIASNEPEQTQVIKYNFSNEPQCFTFEYFFKWLQFINVRLKDSVHFSKSVKRQSINGSALARLLMDIWGVCRSKFGMTQLMSGDY